MDMEIAKHIIREMAELGLKIHRYIMPGIESNMFLMVEDDSAVVVDPNISQEALVHMKECGVKTVTVLITHEHYDHISGVNWLRGNFPIEVIASEETGQAMGDPARNAAKYWNIMLMDMPPERKRAGMEVSDENYACYADRMFAEDIEIIWNNHMIRTQIAPGHSKGGALIWLDDILFSGDNLVNGNGVICRLPGGSWKTYCEKTKPLMEELPDDTLVCPGHGEPARLFELRKYMNKYGSV